ncbi:hypothetical protein FIV42_09570 [Persicimonas caeni]|uniref:Uncharacterized protein n=1 Tax=Persicimonas caeni TaxID=2292766 RepID=A0A4Y6PRK3_PERCE|nr:hypothetical protein [Persicimonas caeni]QDG50974.1 hypothetical protein FIV42_09570 [Persicimonas caeni]QED32195.1 hypothetical protein FRD00_09565 [Persicimonas caeni]
MTERNDGRDSQPNDWSSGDAPPPETQSSLRGDEPKPVPPHEPDATQAPGPQGPREPQGGEWDAGHTVETEPGHRGHDARTWKEGLGEPDTYEESLDRPVDEPPAHQRNTKPKLDNSDIFAIILSAFFPGVGQMMNGQQTKGIVVLLVAIVTGCGVGLLSIASALDTYCLVMAQKRRAVDEWEFFPDIRQWF